MTKKEEKSEGQASSEERMASLQKQNKNMLPFVCILPILVFTTFVLGVNVSLSMTDTVKNIDAMSLTHEISKLKTEIKTLEAEDGLFFEPYQFIVRNEKTQRLLEDTQNGFNDVIEEEKSWLLLLENHRAAVFNIASNVSGSGEWHRFYRRELGDYIDHAKSRINQLKGE